VLIIPEQQESIQPASVTSICPGRYPADPVCAFSGGWPRSPASFGTLRPVPRAAPGGHRPPPLSTPSDRNGAVRMVETTFQLHAVYFQSTFSPLSVHIQSTFSPRTWIHVDPMAFNVERSSGGQGGRGWRPGRAMRPPMPPERGDPTVCRAWPGFGTTFSNLLSNVSPPSWTTGGSTGLTTSGRTPYPGE
jgi:hypothetical protein